MNEDLRKRITAYRISMSVFRGMLREGIITEKEYSKIDTIMAKKYGISSCTIFR